MKTASWKNQLILAVVLFVLGMGAYWLEFRHKPELEKQERASLKVFPLQEGNSVSKITLKTENGLISIQCLDDPEKLCKPEDKSNWSLTSPLNVKADNPKIHVLLSQMEKLIYSSTVDLSKDEPDQRNRLLKEYGLSKESRENKDQIRISQSAGETIVYLGDQHPIEKGVFALIKTATATAPDENRVVVIPKTFLDDINHDLTHWRDKTLVSWSTPEIAKFEIRSSDGEITAKKVDGQWTLQSGKQSYSGDLEAIDNLLTSIGYTSAKDFIAEDKNSADAKKILSPAKKVVSFSMYKSEEKEATPKSVTYEIFESKVKGQTTVYAKISDLDPLYELTAGTVNRFNKTLNDLRQTKLISSTDRFEAKKIEFSGKSLGGEKLTLQSENGKWINSASKQELDSKKVMKTLEKLSGKAIKEFKKKTKPSQEGVLTFKLFDKDDLARREVLFWRSEGKLYAEDLKSKMNETFLIDSSLSESLPWKKDFYLPKKGEDSPKTSDKKEG